MALGALSANPSLRLRIVPVGLSYFHPHKFRSRAVVEFGSPIEIPREFVEDFERGGEAKKGAIGGMMELVVDGLKSVTVRAPDYETLMVSLSLSYRDLSADTIDNSSFKQLVDCIARLDSISRSVKLSN